MVRRIGFALLVIVLPTGCKKAAFDPANLACAADGECLEGWVCDAGMGICVQDGGCVLGEVTSCASCTDDCTVTVLNANAICDTTGATNVCDYDDGCRGTFVDADLERSNGCECQQTNGGVEIACNATDEDCDGSDLQETGTLENCGGCSDSCLGLPHVATSICDDTGGGYACVITECTSGWAHRDANVANGCEAACSPTNGGVETCDGRDNDCNGPIDDVTNVDADCNAQIGDVHAASWTCSAGSCSVAVCENDFWDLNGSGADGCEYSCTRANGGVETCNGADDDCNGVADDVIDLEADCLGQLPGPQPEVAFFGCDSGSCTVAQCNAGFIDANLDATDGCETACTVTNGGVERCDGQDNDCDGTADNAAQDAEGCTDFFLDEDGDGLGVDADQQCWCSPTGSYGALVGGDCDDTIATCTSDCTSDLDNDATMDCADTCIDGDADGYGDAGGAGNTCLGTDCDDAVGTCALDCTTDLDADSTMDCADFCLDADGDGYGDAGGAGNTCLGTDCNDAVGTCAADCTTDLDADSTMDCADFCLDADGDGYGGAGGAGDTCAGPDCDDDPGACGSACNPGITVEICDNYDNDCDRTIDDGLGPACRCANGAQAPLGADDCGASGFGNGVDDDCNDALDDGCATMIQPSNLTGGVDLCQGADSLIVAGENITIDTTWPPSITGMAIPPVLTAEQIDQGGANPPIAVLYFATMDIDATAVVTVTGGSALALAVCTDARIAGELDGCAVGQTGGPGGWDGGNAARDGNGPSYGRLGEGAANNPYQEAGGGGGGYCSAGGTGGDGDGYDPWNNYPVLSGGQGGPASSQPGANLVVPLIGGSGGGGGGLAPPPPDLQVGGGGGGAIQIAAGSSVLIEAGGSVTVCGAGGAATGEGSRWGGGGGGGSGGAVLLEAPSVTVNGTVAANGGGGGGGDATFASANATATRGQDGLSATTRAAGGTGGNGPNGSGGSGGRGGADTGASIAGEDGVAASTGGGGGGGVGFIRLNTDGAGGLTVGGTAVLTPNDPQCYSRGDVTYQ